VALSSLYTAEGEFNDALKELQSLPRENWTPRVALAPGQLEVQTGQCREAVTELTALK
jgi:predicted negative regulator of RcsB-dependent stress response